MPTITQLPLSTSITAADIIPVSQGGSTCAVSLGTFLAGTQPAILIDNGSLLGRVSIGPGSPEQVNIGPGLEFGGGTLIATGADHASFPLRQTPGPSDALVVSSGGQSSLLPVNSLRSLFSSGSNISISAAGVISASAIAASGEPVSTSFSALPPARPVTADDILAVSQAGTTCSATISSILDGVTLTEALPAGSPSETDTFWVDQAGDSMVRQTLGNLSSWIEQRASASRVAVLEVSTSIALNANIHNNKLLVCSEPLTLSPGSGGTLNGFRCDVINLSPGKLTLAAGITSSSGSSSLPAGQSMRLYGLQYSGGSVLYAAIGASDVAMPPPGPPTDLVVTAASSASAQLGWSAPASGAAGLTYYISYRTSGTANWTASLTGTTATQFTVGDLDSGWSYDFYVSASNGASTGSASNIVAVTIPLSDQTISASTGLVASNVTSTIVTLSWTPPGSGQVHDYTVRYRASGSSSWTGSISGLTTPSSALTGLAPMQAYEWQVIATSGGGISASSAIASFTTQSGSQSVTSISWNVVPSGPFSRGSGAIGINAHVNPSSAPIQFGLSTSSTVPPSTWVAATYVNTDLWGAYLSTPVTAGNWYAWAEAVDGSAATAYAQPVVVA